MGHRDNLELLPEPEEPRMLTTIDSDAPGYPGEAYASRTKRRGSYVGRPPL